MVVSMRTSMEASCFYLGIEFSSTCWLPGFRHVPIGMVLLNWFVTFEIMLIDMHSRLCAYVHSFVQRDLLNVAKNRWLVCIISG